MGIYGLGIIGACMFAGCFLGNLLGAALGLNSDVGGVGFAMVFFILIQVYLAKTGKKLNPKTEGGIEFISALYIPVVVAMSMNQDVYSAVASGLVPIISGILAVIIPLLTIPLISKLAKD
ncbi:MAG: malonate transporter subunit MadL [Erysipelotrichaceae bacterium]|jgi:malonate transporter MadL subunit|nr:malonate transporter subunit MadL [Erysipelotrichaceae bacterium]MDO5438511.1 malonate transporter subunit MadL [Erysipelotrichaceae bacterium]